MTTTENPEAAFIAKITASTTHEVRNVLAIVKESAGLIEDMVRSAGKRGQLKEDKVLRAVSRIDAQVGRGAELLTNLNRFAHSLDHDEERINLDEGARRVALLCERFARQKRHEVSVQPCGDDVTILASAVWFQMAIFAGVECCLELLPEPGTVVLGPGRCDGQPAMRLTAEVGGNQVAIDLDQAVGWGRFVGLVDSMGATVGSSSGSGGIVVVFPETGAA
jgi:hypothetical protein